MRIPAILFAATLAACASSPESTPRLAPADLAVVAGSGWKGELTYRDYSPPFGEVTLPVEINVTRTPDGLSLAIHYPSEPHADSTDTLTLSADGTTLGGDPIVSRIESDEALVIVTSNACEDDDRPARCEHTYLFAPHRLEMRKTVQFSDAAPIERNRYALRRD